MDGLRFSWDEAKNASNKKKHGVSFEEAKSVFADDFARLILDPDHSEGEERFILMGMSAKLNLLTICHCEQELNTIRIISASSLSDLGCSATGKPDLALLCAIFR